MLVSQENNTWFQNSEFAAAVQALTQPLQKPPWCDDIHLINIPVSLGQSKDEKGTTETLTSPHLLPPILYLERNLMSGKKSRLDASEPSSANMVTEVGSRRKKMVLSARTLGYYFVKSRVKALLIGRNYFSSYKTRLFAGLFSWHWISRKHPSLYTLYDLLRPPFHFSMLPLGLPRITDLPKSSSQGRPQGPL